MSTTARSEAPGCALGSGVAAPARGFLVLLLGAEERRQALTLLPQVLHRVREDVRQGYVTVAAAAELYGVVLDPDSFEVDMAATAKLRAARPATEDAKSA